MKVFDKLGVAVVGTGYFGRFHARVFKELPEVYLCGVFDTDIKRAETVAREIGSRTYREFEELLDDRNVEAVSLCVSDQAHREPATNICRAGKHLLVEKPLAATVEDCDAIIEAADKAGVKLMVGHILRYDPRYRIAREKVIEGEIGDIIQFYARRSNPIIAARRLGDRCGKYTVIYHNAVHDLDQMLWTLPGDKIKAFAFSREGLLRSEGIGVSDAVVTTLKFENEAVGLMENCWALPEEHPMLIDAVFEITGTRGKIIIDARQQGLAVFKHHGGFEYTDTMYWPELEGRVGGALKEELSDFVRCVRVDEPSPVPGIEGKRAVEAILTIVESLKTGKMQERTLSAGSDIDVGKY